MLAYNKINYYKITYFINFIEVWNSGFILGVFNEYSLSPLFFILISYITLTIISYLLINSNIILQGIILGSNTSNLIDRVLFGKVFDFIDMHSQNYHYPTFNSADSFILLALILELIKKFHYTNKSYQ